MSQAQLNKELKLKDELSLKIYKLEYGLLSKDQQNNIDDHYSYYN